MKITMTEAVCREGMELLEGKADILWRMTPIPITIRSI